MSKDNLTLASNCIQQIRELIIHGELLPGEQIKGEYLKNRLQVGLSPIREALSRLAAGMLVDAVDNVGFRVAKLSRDKVYDSFQTYAKIEALLLRESIEHGNDQWEAQIMACIYRLAKVESRDVKVAYQQWSERNDEFHNALVAGCELDSLMQIRNNCLLIKDWCYGLAYPNLAEEMVVVNHHEHAKMAELAIARKTDAACAMLYKHTLHGLDAIVSRLQRAGVAMR
ncbi:MAG TPA: GntR family transcriptional regulator [Burkholderiales bacterium]|nr:GntR family transcriptional regulator [Burkholderiales bacterium]